MHANTPLISAPGRSVPMVAVGTVRGSGLTVSSCTVVRMHPLEWEYRPDSLRAPALVCAFEGWNDAADAASTAVTFVGSTLGARRFATIDPEEFYDFQSIRPQVKLVDGDTRQIVWPAVELYEARVPRAP